MNKQQQEIEMHDVQQQDTYLSHLDLLKEDDSHPVMWLLHILLKACAFFSYLLLGYIIQNMFYEMIILLICHGVDFYLVKNVTGRYLIGVRWYTDLSFHGQEIYKYEFYNKGEVNAIDSTVFWYCQFGSSCLWAFFVFANIFQFGFIDIFLAGIGACLNWINLWGYYKGSQEQQKKMRNIKQFLAKKGAKYLINQK
ncbi:unnamed protein product [Paramecium sonneborni]|uniref:Golgi apparatus membrane protein TVP23 homolog n=1 Tax=Paramecium sonneborni TaxID=65129 RepID=A0A8S1KN48_9CILI|nr:unnamed protein product [Paramecium sonneborni]